ncbi:CHAT domain-containing protein [Polyangium jinanense]|uniref:CHAT domain-containing protein n=1 Tax=Polyangium jinanense TaxID=2829994 RepID=A0A9X3X562_9BACT|nr:CHAT domain-containing protein [Polyangium jinanense]MDC3960904.1 CHAT domain-containing protein [Polyangium jinanense]MDC3984489.1 CHAT domain-containing protein [Polyangium jinanense]
MGRVKILFLGANARNTTRLQVGLEVGHVKDEIAKAGAGDFLHVEAEFAVRPEQLQSHLQKHAPEVLHFSGHGGGRRGRSGARSGAEGITREFIDETAEQDAGAILLEDRDGNAVAVRPEALTTLIQIVQRGTPLRCVVLNACFTKKQAEDLARHVDCVIGMKCAIGDASAIAFAVGFYRALAKGSSVKTAFDFGCNEIDLRGLPDEDVPELHHRPERNPDSIRLRTASRPSPPNLEGSPPGKQELVMLLLAANPDRQARLRSDREVRQIQERLLKTNQGRGMVVHVRWAVCPDDVLQAVLDLRPRIVHFSGYAMTPQGILLEDDVGDTRAVSGHVLAELFGALRDEIRLVVLNARDSQSHAEAMIRHIDAAIGMSRSIEDGAAIAFASAFYQAIASGLSLGDAFEVARSALRLNGLPGAEIPMLFSRAGVDVARTILFEPTERLAGTASVPRAHDHGIPARDGLGAGDRFRGSTASEPADLLATTAELLAAACPDEASFAALLARVGVSCARIPALRSLEARCECLLLDLAHADRARGLDVLADALSRLDRPGIAAAAAVRRFAAAAKDNGSDSMDALWISLCRRGDGWMLEFRAPGHACGGTVGSTRSARVPVAKETVIQVDVKEAGVAVRVQAGVESPLIGLKARVWTGLTTLSKHLMPWFDERLGPTAVEELTLLEAATTWSELDAA